MAVAFVSYRRETAGSFALLLREKMKELGFDLYLDHKEMSAGRFDTQIVENIKSAKDFILIISKNSLLRSGEPRDYYLEEIETAIAEEKNIIPIFLKNENIKDIRGNIEEKIQEVLCQEGVNEGAPQLFETQFIPRLIELMSDTPDKRMYLSSKNPTVLSSRKRIETESLSERWANAKTISICAYYADQLINSDIVMNKLSEGVTIRYLIVNPTSKAAEDAARYKFSNGYRYRKRKFDLAYQSALDTLSMLEEENIKGTFEMRKTALFIPNAIMIVEKEDLIQNTVKVDFYTFDTEDDDRRSVLIKYEDRDNYNFFVRQFEYIWNSELTEIVSADQ